MIWGVGLQERLKDLGFFEELGDFIEIDMSAFLSLNEIM